MCAIQSKNVYFVLLFNFIIIVQLNSNLGIKFVSVLIKWVLLLLLLFVYTNNSYYEMNLAIREGLDDAINIPQNALNLRILSILIRHWYL